MRRFAPLFAPLLLAAAPPSPFGYTLAVAPGHRPGPLDAGTPGFDAAGNACVRHGDRLMTVPHGGAPATVDFGAAARVAIERDVMGGAKWDGSFDKSLMVDTGIVFDTANRAYTLVVPRYSNLKTAVLLWSAAGCADWHAVALHAVNATMEKPDGFNDRAGPPTILSYENYGAVTGSHLWLESFAAVAGAIRPIAGGPFPVAGDSLLVANHSGGGNSTFTTPGKILVVYPTTDRSAPGALSVARQFDRAAGRWDGPAQPIARSTSKTISDDHDLPAITMGPDRRATVVIGAHHGVFRMLTANAPDSVTGGWSAPTPVGAPELGPPYVEFSYVSLNTSRRGTINIIARAEGYAGKYNLVQFRKPAGGSWRSWPRDAPDRLLATPRRNAYAAWRQHVTLAPSGALYLSFAYFPNRLTPAEARTLRLAQPKAANACQGGRCWYPDAPTLAPVTLVSTDDGATWR